MDIEEIKEVLIKHYSQDEIENLYEIEFYDLYYDIPIFKCTFEKWNNATEEWDGFCGYIVIIRGYPTLIESTNMVVVEGFCDRNLPKKPCLRALADKYGI